MPFITYDKQGKPSYDLSSARLSMIDEEDFEAVDDEEPQKNTTVSTRKAYDLSNAKLSLAGVDMAIDDGDFQIIDEEDIVGSSSSPIASRGTSQHDSPMTPWTQISVPVSMADSSSPLARKATHQLEVTSSPSAIAKPRKIINNPNGNVKIMHRGGKECPVANDAEEQCPNDCDSTCPVRNPRGVKGTIKKMWKGIKNSVEEKMDGFGL